MNKRLIILLMILICSLSAGAQDTVRVMAYNILEWPLPSASNKGPYLRAIFNYYHPDVLICTEVTSDAVATDILDNVINPGVNNYAKAVFTDGPDKDNMIFYNLDKFQLKSQDTIQTALRLINRYRLYHNTTSTDTVYLDCYAAHLKASDGSSNAALRKEECRHFRNYIDTRTQGRNIVFAGDFNFYGSSYSTEPAYSLLLDSGTYHMNDPINLPGEWHGNPSFSLIHTQSTHLTMGGGFVGGGMDDRFDFMLATGDILLNTYGAKYVPGSYLALGNDGNHYNKALTATPLSTTVPDSVTTALYNMSDHLPVVMKIRMTTGSVASHLAFNNVPSSGMVAVNLSGFTVEARTSSNQLNTAFTGNVTLTKYSGPGTVSGTLTRTAVGGIATFSDIQFGAAGTYILQATASGYTSANSSGIVIIAQTATLTELVVPRYMGSKTASTSNTSRTAFSACFQIDGLSPNTTYDIRGGMELTSDPNNSFSNVAGLFWTGHAFTNSNNTVDTAAFTTNSYGSSGPFWMTFQPTGNSSRFGPGQIHNLRIGYAVTGNAIPSNPAFITTNTITALDIPPTSLTPSTTDDGAFLKGSADPATTGKYVLVFDNTAGTGNPLFCYQIRQAASTQLTQPDLPSAINDIYLQAGTSAIGDYPAVVPIGANNPNGVRRIESRNADNSIFGFNTDSDGIWPSGTNSTTLTRRSVGTISVTDAPLVPSRTLNIEVLLESLYLGDGDMIKAQDESGDHFSGDTADLIRIELHAAGNYGTIVYGASDVALSTSGTATLTIPYANNASYYLTVKNRNSLETTSALPLSFAGYSIAYNFTDSGSKAYGSGETMKPSGDGHYLLFGGDVNSDGFVGTGDMSLVDNLAVEFATGYLDEDCNGDGVVDAGDLSVIDNNAAGFVAAQLP